MDHKQYPIYRLMKQFRRAHFDLSYVDKLVLITIASFANENTLMCSLTLKDIATSSGLSRTTVIKTINFLTKKRLILKLRSFGYPNYYRLDILITDKLCTTGTDSDHACEIIKPKLALVK